MEAIAVEGASIATSLQASAAEFLIKFEKVAGENDRTTKRVIWIGICAIVIAVLMPLAQIVHTEVWRAPTDAVTTQVAITEMKSEIAEIRKVQQAAGEKISEALIVSSGEVAAVLKEIKQLLATPKRLDQ